MNDAELRLQVTLDEKGATKSINTLQQNTKSLGDAFTSAGKKLTVGLTLPIVALITAGVNYNSTMETMTTSFKVMTGSAEEAADVMKEIKTIAKRTPFGSKDLAKTIQLLMQYGLSSKEALSSMQMLGDISQGNAEKMQSIALAYGQMSSAGKVNLIDIKQMITAGFNPLKEISERTGESMESLYDRVSNGTISVKEITNSMKAATSEGGMFFNSMEEQSKTMEGKLSTLKDEFMETAGELTTALLPVILKIMDKLSGLFDWFSGLDPEKQELILIMLGIVAAAGPLMKVLGPLIKTFGLVAGAIKGMGLGGLLLNLGLLAAIAGIAIAIVLTVKGLKEAEAAVKAVTELSKANTEKQLATSKEIGESDDTKKKKLAAEGYYTQYAQARKRYFELKEKYDNYDMIEKVFDNLRPDGGLQKLMAVQLEQMSLAQQSVVNLGTVGIEHFRTLGGKEFAKGSNYIENDGLAYLHKGEAVIPQKYNPYAEGQAYNTNSSAINNNFEIGSLNVRNDNDINLIAEQLYYLQKKEVV